MVTSWNELAHFENHVTENQDAQELREWTDALSAVSQSEGSTRAIEILNALADHAVDIGLKPSQWSIADDDMQYLQMANGMYPVLRERLKREIEDAMTELPARRKAADRAFHQAVLSLRLEEE